MVVASHRHIGFSVWSPCNRFIAIGSMGVVDILDSATLQLIQRLDPPQIFSLEALAFSPGGHLLAAFFQGSDLGTGGPLVSWDLQTGGVVSTIKWKEPCNTRVAKAHMTYSMDGKMVAVLSHYYESSTISIHDVISGVSMPYIVHGGRTGLDFGLRTSYVYKIWTHEESLRFATTEPTGITIWEVGFTSGAAPMEVESVSIPDNPIQPFVFKPRQQRDITWTEFHPASCRLAFTYETLKGAGIMIWDARASRFLLQHTDIVFRPSMSFSPDARFFACATMDSEVYLWKESPTGYTLFEKLVPGSQFTEPCFSSNGKSIIVFGGSTIQLWYMKSLTPTTSNMLTPALRRTTQGLVLGFHPDGQLAVYTRKRDTRVKVLDIKSGAPRLTIDTSMEVYGLRPIGNTIVVIGKEAAIAWNLPGGNVLPDARMDVRDSAWNINLGNVDDREVVFAASISPDFQCVAYLKRHLKKTFLEVYYPTTGQTHRIPLLATALWFAPGGNDIWCATGDGGAEVFTLTQDTLDRTNSVADIEDARWGCPWGSRRGYKITEDGWILGAGGKRLFMLPSLWRSQLKEERVWNSNFLAFMHGGVGPEPVILELEP